MPEFVENIQRYDGLGVCVQRIHIRIVGKHFYKTVKGKGQMEDQEVAISGPQMLLLILQYLDSPLATFALCLGSLACLKDLTLRFTDCRGGEVSLQSISLHKS
jgi:hypothetical protein